MKNYIDNIHDNLFVKPLIIICFVLALVNIYSACTYEPSIFTDDYYGINYVFKSFSWLIFSILLQKIRVKNKIISRYERKFGKHLTKKYMEMETNSYLKLLKDEIDKNEKIYKNKKIDKNEKIDKMNKF